MIREFKLANPTTEHVQNCDHVYREEFRKLGLRFGTLRSDTCKKCDELYVKELDTNDETELMIIREESRLHHEKADTANKHMHNDIDQAKTSNENIVLCIDLQQVCLILI